MTLFKGISLYDVKVMPVKDFKELIEWKKKEQADAMGQQTGKPFDMMSVPFDRRVIMEQNAINAMKGPGNNSPSNIERELKSLSRSQQENHPMIFGGDKDFDI
jgi:hypothetical protein